MGYWKVKVVSVTLDADEIVASQNEFNRPPQAEDQYVLVKVEATRTGGEPAAFWADVYCTFAGSGGSTFETTLADVPDSIKETAKASKDASVSGTIVFEVAADQVPGGVLVMKQSLSPDAGRLFFALQ